MPAGFKGSAAKLDTGKQGREQADLAYPPVFPWLCSTTDTLIIPVGASGAATSEMAFGEDKAEETSLISADVLYRCKRAFSILPTQPHATKPS